MESICIIENNRITVDGQTVFETSADLDFAAFAKLALKNLDITYPKFYKMDKLCKLGFIAAEYLFTQNSDIHHDESTAIIFGSSSGSLDSDAIHLQNIEQPSPAVFVYTLPNIVVGEIAIRHGIKGETAFFMCEDENDDSIRKYIDSILKNNVASSCIAGWVEYVDEHYLARLGWINN